MTFIKRHWDLIADMLWLTPLILIGTYLCWHGYAHLNWIPWMAGGLMLIIVGAVAIVAPIQADREIQDYIRRCENADR